MNMRHLMAGILLLFVYLNAASQSRYDPYALFAPSGYPYGSNLIRNGAGEPGPAYWQNRADYKITASLDETKNEVRGTVLLTYTNNSPDVLPHIWLMLEQNLFTPESRGFAKLPASGKSRYGDSRNGFKGGFNLGSVKLVEEGGREMAADTVITDTRMHIRLPKGLSPKSKTQVKIDFSFIVPEYGADRMGYLNTRNGKVYAIAQWYPKVCVYDDIRGWNADPYLGPSEFYLEYGDFDVSLTAPAGHIVVASGELMNPQDVLTPDQLKRYNQAKASEKTIVIRSAAEAGTAVASMKKAALTWRYRINNARDFAWASSAGFIWDGARINLSGGKTALAQSAYPVESSDARAWARSTEFIKASIENYSRRWYEFPYPAAVNVASNVSGMEYPGIVFCGWEDKDADLWGVTDHEFGHTWFPMIVGSNERRYGWMDEGFNTFINQIASGDFNKGEFRQSMMDGVVAGQYLTNEATEKVMLTPDAMSERNIGVNLYIKPGYALWLLRNQVVGEKRFDYAFRKYIRDWAYKHPTPWDFFRSMESSLGEDLHWFWKGLFLENYKLDQGITGVETTTGGILITLVNNEKMAMPVVLDMTTASGTVIRKTLPVEIWHHGGTYTLMVPTTEKVRKIVVDPEQAFPDGVRENNVWQGLK
jgi:hypothetical protein